MSDSKSYWAGVWARLKNCWTSVVTGICFIVYVFTNVYVGEEVVKLVSLIATVVMGIVVALKEFKFCDKQPTEKEEK